jgi:hypothetical protein
MARRISLPIKVETDVSGEPVAFTWRGVRRRVWVMGRWHLRARWRQPWERQRDCHCYWLLTANHAAFESYREQTSRGLWILDVVLGCPRPHITYLGVGAERARGARPAFSALRDAAIARGGNSRAVSQAGGVQAGGGSTMTTVEPAPLRVAAHDSPWDVGLRAEGWLRRTRRARKPCGAESVLGII